MTEREDVRASVARLIRQSLDMGEVEWFLDGMDRRRVLELAQARPWSSGIPDRQAARGGGVAPKDEAHRVPSPSRASGADPSSRSSVPASAASEPRSDAGAGTPPSAKAPEGGRVDLPVLPDDYEALRDLALGCTLCGLSETRTQVVFSDGAPDARLMVVGEAPGANEDETGLPFVGAAGKFLDLLLATVDLSREESVYICNVLKCRPPGNRNPKPEEIEACSPYLRKQIELVRPQAILAVGSFSAQLLTGRDKTALGRLRGEVHSYQGVPLVVTYHPAALLRNANWTRAFWDDLQLLRDVMDQAG